MILSCKFDNDMLQDKIKYLNIESSNISLMEKVLDSFVDEIFNTFSYSGEVLTFEEWEKWFKSINLSEKILNFHASLL